MISKQAITEFLESNLAGTPTFIVEVKNDADNNIAVELDSPTGVDLDTCIALTRAFEQAFDREVEDYELEIGGAGLTSPFRVPGQWLKNVGKQVGVLTADSRKLKATLQAFDGENATLSYSVKEKVEGQKKPAIVEKTETLPLTSIRRATLLLDF